MTRTVFQPAARGAHGPWSGATTDDGSLEPVPGYGHEVMVSPAGDMVVDLAQADPPEVGCVVDLAQWDVPAAGTSSATGHRAPGRSGGAERLSPSWPSVLRVTNAFGTTDLTDARERPTP